MDIWLRSSLLQLTKTNENTDCVFLIEDTEGIERFPVHKLIFSCASKVFEHMLYGEDAEKSGRVEFPIQNIDRHTFEILRDYIYSYDENCLVPHANETLLKLLNFAFNYRIDSIQNDCCLLLKAKLCNMSPGDLLKLFECSLKISDDDLSKKAIEMLAAKWNVSMDSSLIYEFKPSVFAHYIRLTRYVLSELTRYNMIELYAKMNNCDNIKLSKGEVSANLQSTETPNSAVNLTKKIEPASIDDDYLSDLALLFNENNQSLPEITVGKFEEEFNDEYVRNLLREIDFKRFTPQEFYNGPGTSSFLTSDQKFQYMYQISLALMPCGRMSAAEQVIYNYDHAPYGHRDSDLNFREYYFNNFLRNRSTNSASRVFDRF